MEEYAGVPIMSHYRSYNEDRKERIKKLDEVLKESNVKSKYLPKYLVEYWINRHQGQEKHKIKEIVKEIRINAKNYVHSVEKGRAPLIGQMGTEIAKDIVDTIIPKDVKIKLTGPYYDKMQECLALYGWDEKRNELKKLFNELGLLDKGSHPFLKLVINKRPKSTQQFYKQYFSEKIRWIEDTFYKKVSNKTEVSIPSNSNEVPYSIAQISKKSKRPDLDTWLKRNKKSDLNSQPIVDIPVGIFDEPIKKAICKSQNIEYTGQKMHELLMLSVDKKMQPFYTYKRQYEVRGEVIKFELKEGGRFDDFLDAPIEKMIKEELIRFRTEPNRLSKYISRSIEKEIPQKIRKETHGRIAGNEKSLRIQQEKDISMAINLENRMGIALPLNEIDEILNKSHEITIDINGVTIYDTRKRKDYGLFMKLTNDKRIPGLLSYMSVDRISYSDIRDLIRRYSLVQILIMERTFKLEQAIYNVAESEILEAFDKEEHIKHDVFLDWLIKESIVTEEQRLLIKKIRDKFAHNQVPMQIMGISSNDTLGNIWQKYDTITNEILGKISRKVNKN